MSLQQINVDVLQDLVIHEPLAIVGQRFGDLGIGSMKDILRFLKRCAANARVGEATDLKVFALMEADPEIDTARLSEASEFKFGVTVTGEISSLVIEIRANGVPYMWRDAPSRLSYIINTAVVYRLFQGVETFEIAGTAVVVPKVIENSVSQFFFHYFDTLKEALFAYRDTMARTSTCYLLREAWYDDNRLWFQAGPEYKLRRALCNFLRGFLRYDDMWIRPEQNVDESHPVDIKVTWRADNRAALIEVKWIGKSRSKNKITANHTDHRARAGAKQLAEYLESDRQESAVTDARGYLVVFDCRRRGLKLTTTTISRNEGMYYSAREVRYDPKYHLVRNDFELPIRMFLEPVSV